MSVELDLRVQKEIFGYSTPQELEDLPTYSTSIEFAWKIVELLEMGFWTLNALRHLIDNECWTCEFRQKINPWCTAFGSALTPELAICYAGLKAREKK